MRSEARTPDKYMEGLPEDRKAGLEKLRAVILKNLPKGFEECMGYGMIGYVVPHSLYPAGYHCDPRQPLPFMGFASQKNAISFYHMGIYADPELLKWFQEEYAKAVPTKLDMGKSCVRFKKVEHIPYELIGKLVKKIKPADWIRRYEEAFKKGGKK